MSKLSFSKFVQLLENNNNGYYQFQDIKDGCIYWLSEKPTESLINELKSFNNVEMLISQCQYAPEIKTSCIFIKE